MIETSHSLFSRIDKSPEFYNEILDQNGHIRSHYKRIYQYFSQLSPEGYQKLNEYAKVSFFNQGITFNVYSDHNQGTEKIFPFDLFPRLIPGDEWQIIEKGIEQRTMALNMLIHDLYNQKQILKDGVIPPSLIFTSKYFSKHMLGANPPGNIYAHIIGTDLIKHKDGAYYVLEDNARCPSGISYVLANRVAMKKVLSGLFRKYQVQPIVDYPAKLLKTMQSVAPAGVDDPVCVLLTPGMMNSAYYEHTFLASQMGIQLVEGRDLFVDNNFVYMKTIYGPQRVDVIYQRVDDEFLDPLVIREDSLLGIPGIMAAYRAGNVTMVNAPGTGFADNKAVYQYIPQAIKYYLDQDPIIKNVPTYRCDQPKDQKYVLENMEKLVVKPVDESGRYGVFIGNTKTKKEITDYKTKIKANPRKYIAQPVMALSVHPTFIKESEQFENRHIDLRVFALSGKEESFICKGGLSRVALKRGNHIVNSSQGGGSKDSWALS